MWQAQAFILGVSDIWACSDSCAVPVELPCYNALSLVIELCGGRPEAEWNDPGAACNRQTRGRWQIKLRALEGRVSPELVQESDWTLHCFSSGHSGIRLKFASMDRLWWSSEGCCIAQAHRSSSRENDWKSRSMWVCGPGSPTPRVSQTSWRRNSGACELAWCSPA